MTTIAIDHDSISADGRATDGNGYISSDNKKKLFKRDDVIYAFAGAVSDGNSLIDLVLDGISPSSNDLDCNLVTIDDEEILMHSFVDGVLRSWQVTPPYTLGSGDHFALAAMDLGLNSKQAVKLAMKRDSGSGGRIQTIKYKKG